jgi:hypothetical protein
VHIIYGFFYGSFLNYILVISTQPLNIFSPNVMLSKVTFDNLVLLAKQFYSIVVVNSGVGPEDIIISLKSQFAKADSPTYAGK